MSERIRDLEPGDLVDMEGSGTGLFLARVVPHPLYPRLALVIWWVVDQYSRGGRWSFDALSTDQSIMGAIRASTADERRFRIKMLLQGSRDA